MQLKHVQTASVTTPSSMPVATSVALASAKVPQSMHLSEAANPVAVPVAGAAQGSSYGMLGKTVTQAATAITDALSGHQQLAGPTASPAQALASVEQACTQLRPWQKCVLARWLLRQLPSFCTGHTTNSGLLPVCKRLSSFELKQLWCAGSAVKPTTSGSTSSAVGTAESELLLQALRCGSTETQSLFLIPDDASRATAIMGLLLALQADGAACALAASVALGAVTSCCKSARSGADEPDVSSMWSLQCALALVRTVHCSLCALGAGSAVASALLQALPAGASALVQQAVCRSAAQLQAASASEGAQGNTDAALHSEVIAIVGAQASFADALADAVQPGATRLAAVARSAADGSAASPLDTVSAATRDAAAHLTKASTAQTSTSDGHRCLAGAVASVAVAAHSRLNTHTPKHAAAPYLLLQAAHCVVPPEALDAFQTALVTATTRTLAHDCQDASSAAAAPAAALLRCAIACGTLSFDHACAVAQQAYDSATPGSHALLVTLFADCGNRRTPSKARKGAKSSGCELPAGVAAAMTARQRRLPPAALHVLLGTAAAQRSLLPDALSALGAAGNRARAAAGAVLACDATRLALLDSDLAVPMHGLHLEGAVKQTQVSPTWAAVLAFHSGRVAPMPDVAQHDFAATLQSLLLRCEVPSGHHRARVLVAAGMEQATMSGAVAYFAAKRDLTSLPWLTEPSRVLHCAVELVQQPQHSADVAHDGSSVPLCRCSDCSIV